MQFSLPFQNTEDYLFQVILEKTIRIPRSLSVKAATVLKAFLDKNPADRLGCSRENSFLDIVNHPFFKAIDWESVSEFVSHLKCTRAAAINTLRSVCRLAFNGMCVNCGSTIFTCNLDENKA